MLGSSFRFGRLPVFQFFFDEMMDQIPEHFFNRIGIQTFLAGPSSALFQHRPKSFRSVNAGFIGFESRGSFDKREPLPEQRNHFTVKPINFCPNLRNIVAILCRFHRPILNDFQKQP
jgi:hypothetical protein